MKIPKVLTYTVIFEKATEGGYIAHVPLLPGCTTQGETFAEAKSNIKDAIGAYLDVLKADGDQIPVEDNKHVTTKIAVPMTI
ncbi:MAG: type II toxin-antitoxin system HicB family antitoxin [Candidatus Gracilibacteria bacterium]|jgi:predicted RNase H-like HicB family nuclease